MITDIPKDMREKYIDSLKATIERSEGHIEDVRERLKRYEYEIELNRDHFIPEAKIELESLCEQRRKFINILEVAKKCRVIVENG